jgi:signal transduction histidine kinase
LSTLADQTAVALQNARLFDDLKIQNGENARLNQELTAANRELARLDQSRSDFIQIASHELRTPLTNVRGYIDLLSELVKHEALTTEGGEQVVQGVRTAIQRLEEITKAMFDVSRIDTETLTLKLWPTSLVSTVNKAAEAWGSALRQRRQTLTTLGLEDLPVIVADSTRLEQAFSHLIQNAIKFTPNGGEIRIWGHLRDEDLPVEEQTVEIIVVDNGLGVAPDDLERIFEKFYRVGDVMLHSTGKTKFKGAGPGLGLTIVRGIVEAHGGFIWAESPGRSEESCPGTEFHVILPVQARVEEPAGLETALADTHG